MRRINLGVASFVVLCAIWWCGLTNVSCGGTSCPGVAYVSIFANLVDGTGEDLEYEFDDAVVEYREGTNGEWMSCSAEWFPTAWICAGWENPGVYDVRATVGELSGMVTDIRVPQDRHNRCNVTTQSVDVVMQ